MTKTTVYLPKEVKQALKSLAGASGRSEASLIRDALGALARQAQRPRPHGALWESGDPTLSVQAHELLAGFGDR